MALTIATLFASAVLVFGDELRTWSDSTGKLKIEASFVSQDKGKVTLKDKDGKQFEIEVAKLSAEDRKYLTELAKKPEPENPFKQVGSDKLIKPDWSGARLAKGFEKVMEFNPADAKGRGQDIRWATFLNKKQLLTASYGGGMVVLWELPSLKPIGTSQIGISGVH